MNYKLLPGLTALLLLTGCGSDVIADRVYTQAIGLSDAGTLSLTLQGFEEDSSRTVQSGSITQALALAQANAGGRVFVGHTELLCLDGTVTTDGVQELFFSQGISPACKIVYASPSLLHTQDSTGIVHTIRMAERDGLLAETDLAGVLNEWLGAYHTALVPVPAETLPSLVLLSEDGSVTELSEAAAAGMFWLRQPPREAAVTVGQQTLTVQEIRMRKELTPEGICCTLTLKAPDTDPAVRKRLRSKLLSDCEAAAAAISQENADVIGLQELYERENQPLPEVLPEIRIKVAVSG